MLRYASTVLLLLLVGGCSALPERAQLPDEFARPPSHAGVLAERSAPTEAEHPGQSGFRLISTGAEAYALRALSAEVATGTLDIQTYIWHADPTGKLLAGQALAAADRGVRVRILVDDLDARRKNIGFAALDAHPRMEVRLYNPTASRKGPVRIAGEFGMNFKRLNHRMHNKSWIVDNRVALVGGRNLGDEYFDAHDGTNFVDLDFFMVGPIVQEASNNFDAFWNSASNYPVSQLAPDAAGEAALGTLRQMLDATRVEMQTGAYAKFLRKDPNIQAILQGGAPLHWTAQWTFVSDDPLKARLPLSDRSAVLKALLPAMRNARHHLRLISPYFVPGERGTNELVMLQQRGVELSILTNSLAANDVAAVHGGYMRYRPELLRKGIRIWELKPMGEPESRSLLSATSGSSLHTKAMIADDTAVFVGSYNLDPRSTSLNTEQGILVSHPAIAEQLTEIFRRETEGDRAWEVSLDDGALRWGDGTESFKKEPETSFLKRARAWLIRFLPVHSQL